MIVIVSQALAVTAVRAFTPIWTTNTVRSSHVYQTTPRCVNLIPWSPCPRVARLPPASYCPRSRQPQSLARPPWTEEADLRPIISTQIVVVMLVVATSALRKTRRHQGAERRHAVLPAVAAALVKCSQLLSPSVPSAQYSDQSQ